MHQQQPLTQRTCLVLWLVFLLSFGPVIGKGTEHLAAAVSPGSRALLSLNNGGAAAAVADAALNSSATDALVSLEQLQGNVTGSGDGSAEVTPAASSPGPELSPEPSSLEQQQQQANLQPSSPVLSSSQLQLSVYELLAGQQLTASLDLSSLGGLAGGRAVTFSVVRSNTISNSNNTSGLANNRRDGGSAANSDDTAGDTAGSACSPNATSTSTLGLTGTTCSFAQPGSYAVAATLEGSTPQLLLSSTITVLADPTALSTQLDPTPVASPEPSSSSSGDNSSAPPEPPQSLAPPPLPAAVWPASGEAAELAEWNYITAATTPAPAPPAPGTVSISSTSQSQQLLPIKAVTCYYDPKRGLLTGLRYSRPTEDGQLLTRRIGKTTSRLTSGVSLRDGQYITALNVSFTSRAVLALKFHLNTGSTQACEVTRAVFDAPSKLRGNQVTSAAKSVSAVQARMAAMLAAGVYDAGYPMYPASTEQRAAELIVSQYSAGPTMLGSHGALASIVATADPRNRYMRWLPVDVDEKRKRRLAKLKLHWTAVDDQALAVSAAETKTRECSWWPCRDCHGYWDARNCCCWSVEAGQGNGGGHNGRPTPTPGAPKPRKSPRPRPRRSPHPIIPPWWPRPSPAPKPGKSPKPPRPPGPPPGPPRPPPGPPQPPPPPPRPPRSPPVDNTTGGNASSPSPKPRRSPRPRPRRPSPSPGFRPGSPQPLPEQPNSPRPTDPLDSPQPDLPTNFTISFASRGQHACVQPVSPVFRARAFQYAMAKLSSAGFGQDYMIVMGACGCKVDDKQKGMPIYSCEATVNVTNPEVGSPDIIAGYVAMDIDTSGPFACFDESQPWCQQAEEYPTSACAVFPSEPGHICVIEPPPDPLPIPIVFVDEGKKCNASMQLTAAQQASLREYVFKFTAGLGLVLTYENFTCQEGGGNALYQATLILAAGVDTDIYTGSENIVLGINAKPNLCQLANPPSFCNSAPFTTAMMCTVNEYNPKAVYRCPNAAASAQVSFGLAEPACDCAATPDNSMYQRNVAVWVTDMMVQNSLSIRISVPEGNCIQQNATTCQYEYRVRAQPLDEFTDSFAAIQTIATEVTNNPQPCWPAEAASGWPFCQYWQRVTACAASPWDPTKELTCSIMPTDGDG